MVSSSRTPQSRQWSGIQGSSTLAGEWHEPHRNYLLGANRPVVLFLNQRERLNAPSRPHGNHHPPARLELLYERRRHLIRAGRHHDRVEGSALLPSLVAVPRADLHVAAAKALESRSRLGRERRHDLDGVDRAHALRRPRPLATPARAALAHA